ncbi:MULTISPECIES: preprotein translocase subunit YajC [unclassified Halothiobacillus]|jgi:preprotein translocase subunit YajC|uniref:preprotein translocase subunit YajC n=1 Tax=unclassified Halothiobacillus TaxID=2636392 RepID=UPI000BCF2A92|nr:MULTISPECIES: preprotein translocase subunit YajC [unclassified Halothiobacillus]OZB56665.1 MAG: preprotein translocase subunit YajC [Halothiobacillus sp. 14-56-357]OZB78899.1 MAG: preprotein translocase subunit YajC [Halothiobacillus sp. 13-55-115]MDD4967394.1 preprotein translocase subunit YajC [Halothiobacillus sp.]MDY0148052.1 preprotein translocase subunit YajC [Halothiobacillus sp.]OZB36947.1 MAG: preprotein translocase subunit YajC [Halothiobacillus sp. 15-55-196]
MFFISDALAEAAPAAAQQPSMIATFLPLILIFGVMYFLLIRPQVKRQKELKKLVESIEKGDEIITNGGLLGRVVKVTDAFLIVEVADGMTIVVQRGAVSSVMPKGTLKDTREA